MTRLAGAALFALLVGCAGGRSRAASAPVANTPAQPIVEEKTAAGQPRVEISNLGAEPRQPLRLRVTPGAPAGADVVITMDTRVEAQATESKSRMAFGWMGSVMTAGDPIRVEARFDRLEMDDEPVEHDQTAFTYTLLPTAALASFDVMAEAPALMDAALAESVRQTLGWLVVFPTAAVGVGARWRVETEYTKNGIPVVLSVTCELHERAGDHAIIRGSLSFRSAAGQPAFIEGTGELEVELDLTHVVPRSTLSFQFRGEVVLPETRTKLSGESTMTLTPRP